MPAPNCRLLHTLHRYVHALARAFISTAMPPPTTPAQTNNKQPGRLPSGSLRPCLASRHVLFFLFLLFARPTGKQTPVYPAYCYDTRRRWKHRSRFKKICRSDAHADDVTTALGRPVALSAGSAETVRLRNLIA